MSSSVALAPARIGAWTRSTCLAAAGWLLLALYLGFLNPHLDIKSYNSHDPATYLAGAEAIWRGDGYGLRYADAYLPMKLQPPGLSVLLAPVVGLAGMNFVVIKLLYVGLSALLAYSAFRLFRSQFGTAELAGLATVWLMACPVIFRLGHQVMAEIPLLFCVTVAVLHLDRYLRAPGRLVTRDLWIAAAATAAAAFFKGLGLSVLAGAWLLLLARRWRTPATLRKLALYSALVAVPVALWLILCHFTPNEGFHGRSIADFYLLKDPYQAGSPGMTAGDWVQRLRYVIRWGLAGNIALLFVAPAYFAHHHPLVVLLGLGIGAALAWQWWLAWQRGAGVLEGFAVVGLLGVMLYVHGNAARFLALVYPAMLVYGLRAAAPWLRRPWGWAAAAILLALSIGTTTAVAYDQFKDPYGHAIVRDYIAIAADARTRFPSGSRCAAPMSLHWQLLTGHRCLKHGITDSGELPDYAVVFLPSSGWDEETFEYFKRDLIVSGKKIDAAVVSRGAPAEPIAANTTFRLLKLRRP